MPIANDQSWSQLKDTAPDLTRGRYAPSPSGPLHLGNFRTALLAWLQARLSGSRYLLRIEDLDLPRMRPGYDRQMLEELTWLGLDWDEGPCLDSPDPHYYQSKRTFIYEAALTYLKQQDLVYPCFCSRKDILQAASAPHEHQGLPPYPGTCRALTPHQLAAKKASNPNRQAAWRFKVPNQTVQVNDVIAGNFCQNLARDVGDFVIKRADGLFAYQLAVVVDDGLMGVRHVLRGSDLLDSTPRQILLFNALGLETPHFWHVPLVRDSSGQRLAKRDGSAGLHLYRDQGFNANRIIGALAASFGWLAPNQEISPDELSKTLVLETFIQSLKSPPPITLESCL